MCGFNRHRAIKCSHDVQGQSFTAYWRTSGTTGWPTAQSAVIPFSAINNFNWAAGVVNVALFAADDSTK
jgi:hypothetical protein